MHDVHEGRILAFLHQHRGYHTPEDVADALVLPREEVQRQLHRLQEAGLVAPFSMESESYGITYQGIEATARAA